MSSILFENLFISVGIGVGVDSSWMSIALPNQTLIGLKPDLKEARSLGETVPEITFSKKFQCILAARTLNKNVDDILSLNIQE
jgi:hypothetical protein